MRADTGAYGHDSLSVCLQTENSSWTEALNIKQVGIHDNFLDLGGNSLAALQVIAQVDQVFQVELPLRSPFEAPTIAELAEVIEEMLIAEIADLTEDQAQNLSERIDLDLQG